MYSSYRIAPPDVIELGFAYGNYGRDRDGLFDSVAEQALAAEEAGFDSIWVPDHLMQAQAVAPVDYPMIECYTTLGALAALTSTVRLGAFVGCAAYRSAALLGKMVTTLDVISGGRAIFGIGAGWYETEHAAYGFDLGHHGERYERLEETIEIVTSMFSTDVTTFHGKHFSAEHALNSPRPVQPGGPPIMIGGTGERRTLRLVAQHADLCNVLGPPETVRHLMAVLDDHSADLGRDPSTICRTVTAMVVVRDSTAGGSYAMPPSPLKPVTGTYAEVVSQLRDLLAAGIDGLILSCTEEDSRPEYISMLSELAAEARAGR